VTFAERVASSPLNAASACLVMIPVAIWIVSMVGWMVQGDVDFLPGALSIAMALALALGAMNPPLPWMGPLCFLAALLTVVAFVPIRKAIAARDLRQIDDDQLRGAYEAWQRHPGNVAAVYRMATLMAQKGKYAQAVALADQALPSMPASAFRAEHRAVEAWRQHAVAGPTVEQCPGCDRPNPIGTIRCPGCGGAVVLGVLKGRSGIVGRVLAVWFVAVAALVAGPYVVALARTQPVVASVIAVVVLAVGVWFTVSAFVRPRAAA
jgi:hypothetical protein